MPTMIARGPLHCHDVSQQDDQLSSATSTKTCHTMLAIMANLRVTAYVQDNHSLCAVPNKGALIPAGHQKNSAGWMFAQLSAAALAPPALHLLMPCNTQQHSGSRSGSICKHIDLNPGSGKI